jgi:TolA-binding protein
MRAPHMTRGTTALTPSVEFQIPPFNKSRPRRPGRVWGGCVVALLLVAALIFVVPGAADSRVAGNRLGPLTTRVNRERANIAAATARLATLQAEIARLLQANTALQSRLDGENSRLLEQEAQLARLNAARAEADRAAIAAAARASAETGSRGGR